MEVKDNYMSNFALHTAFSLMIGLPFIYFWGYEEPFVRIIPFALFLVITIIGFIKNIIDSSY